MKIFQLRVPLRLVKWKTFWALNTAIVVVLFVNYLIKEQSPNMQLATNSDLTSTMEIKVNYQNTRLNHEWILNKNILQYSSYIVIREKNKVIIESIVVLVEKKTEKTENWKCVLQSPNTSISVYAVTGDYRIGKRIYFPSGPKYVSTEIRRVLCEFTSTDRIDEQSLVAIVDSNDFDQNKMDSDMDFTKLSFKYLKYQLPDHINATMPKKQSIGHCIHMIYDLEFTHRKDSLSQFLDTLADLKIDKVRMYIYRHHSLADLNLLKKHKFLTIVHHDAVHHRVCQLEIYNLKRQPNSKLFQHMYDHCLATYESLFQIIEVARVKNIHDELNTNDCYLNFRYSYEIVTNYDFDEFIWPHKGKIGKMQTLFNDMQADLKSVCQYNSSNPNAYVHESGLLNEHKNLLVLRLEHVVMIGFTPNLDDFFQRLNQTLWTQVITQKINVLYYEFGRTVKFSIESNDVDYAKQLVRYYNIARQMYSYLNKTNVRYNFNRAVAIHMPVRLGKSIFNTDKVEMITVHEAYMPNEHQLLPYNVEYVSHFREEYNFFDSTANLHSIRKLYVDLEYYHYLFKKFASPRDCNF